MHPDHVLYIGVAFFGLLAAGSVVGYWADLVPLHTALVAVAILPLKTGLLVMMAETEKLKRGIQR